MRQKFKESYPIWNTFGKKIETRGYPSLAERQGRCQPPTEKAEGLRV